MTKRIIFEKGKVGDFLEGDIPSRVVEDPAPTVRWTSTKIPYPLWRSVMTFFISHKSEEVCVYLMLHRITKTWHIFVPEQTVTGASVNITHGEDVHAALKDHDLVGNIHTHPGFGAFMSHTDEGSEHTTDGVYITIGRLDNQIAESDIRTFLSGYCYKNLPPLEDLVENPCPEFIDRDTFSFLLLRTKPSPGYPKEWDARIIKLAEYNSDIPTQPWWDGHRGTPENPKEQKKNKKYKPSRKQLEFYAKFGLSKDDVLELERGGNQNFEQLKYMAPED